MRMGPRSHRMLHLFVNFLAAQYISFMNRKAADRPTPDSHAAVWSFLTSTATRSGSDSARTFLGM
jgi:hypothetical protein